MLSTKLQTEQAQLAAEVQSLKDSVAEQEKATGDVDGFMEVIRSVEQIGELDADVLNALIDRIEVGEKTTGEDGQIFQRIDISYRFVGKLDL